jgi:hypothetical protein
MMDKRKIPARTQLCFIDNLEPDGNGCYPDWSGKSAGKYKYKFKHQTEKVGDRWKSTGELRYTGFRMDTQ